MPEGYTHVRTANRAAALAQLEIAHPAAFACGANGPDIFFCYRAWKSGEKRGENLPELGERLHDENTGAFLRALVEYAATPAQRSYALGFLSHYAADCTVHPYVVCVTGEGGPYAGPGGHGYFEIAVDSFLHEQDTGKAAVPVDDTTPRLAGAALAEVGALLQKSLREAFGVTVSREALADTFWHTRALRRMFVSRFRIKYALFWLVEPAFGGRGAVTGHITPARLVGTGKHPKGSLPCPWTHPFTGEEQTDDLNALLEKAEKRSAAYLLAAKGYWDGRLSMEKLSTLLGSASYLSGLADERSCPGLAPEKKPAPRRKPAETKAETPAEQPARTRRKAAEAGEKPAAKKPALRRKPAETKAETPAEQPARTRRKAAEAGEKPAAKRPARRKLAPPKEAAPEGQAPAEE